MNTKGTLAMNEEEEAKSLVSHPVIIGMARRTKRAIERRETTLYAMNTPKVTLEVYHYCRGLGIDVEHKAPPWIAVKYHVIRMLKEEGQNPW